MSRQRRLLLDGIADEELRPLPPGPGLLGSDPFEETGGRDVFLEALDALRARLAAGVELRTSPPPELEPLPREAETPGGSADLEAKADAREPRETSSRRRVRARRLTDVEPSARPGLLERLLGDADQRRLAALDQLVPEGGYDRFGLSSPALRAAFPLFLGLHRVWFRVRSAGVANLPAEGAAVLAANHGGLLPFDGAMLVTDVLLHTDPPRLLRAVVDRGAGALPWVNVFFARVGQVIGTRENVAALLRDGQLVLVFPEGVAGARKPITQRYRLQAFHTGFIEQALRARAPILPVAVLGAEDQAPVLADVPQLARWLGVPVFPITPTFPWLGPLGLLPYPVSYRIVYGEPFRFHERYGPEGADDARLVRYLGHQVRRAVQGLLDRNRR